MFPYLINFTLKLYTKNAYNFTHVYSGHFESLSSISSKVSKPSVAPNFETTEDEFTDAYINALQISILVLPNAALNVEANASPAPNVETTSPSKTGQQ